MSWWPTVATNFAEPFVLLSRKTAARPEAPVVYEAAPGATARIQRRSRDRVVGSKGPGRCLDDADPRTSPPAIGTSSSCSSTAAGPPGRARRTSSTSTSRTSAKKRWRATRRGGIQAGRGKPSRCGPRISACSPTLSPTNFATSTSWSTTSGTTRAGSSTGWITEQEALITSGQGMKSWNAWRRNSRYHLENFLGALDAPGEWFLARDGTLYYHPLPGEDMTTPKWSRRSSTVSC